MPEGTESSSHESNERRTWDKGAGISFFSGGWASRLCSHVWLKQLDWNCAYAGWGMGGPHTSPGKRAGKCGDTGVVPFSTTDSGPNTQAVMGFGGTGHMANGQQQRLDSCTHSAVALGHLLSPWVPSGALSLQRHAREWCQALHFSWIPEPAKNVSDELQVSSVASGELGIRFPPGRAGTQLPDHPLACRVTLGQCLASLWFSCPAYKWGY